MSISEPEILLRRCELRLLRCTLLRPPPPEDSESGLPSPVEALLASTECGRYAEALRCPAAVALDGAGAASDAEETYSELVGRVEAFLEEEKGLGVVTLLGIAVAAFLAFVQANVTGPLEEGMPKSPLVSGDGHGEWDTWATKQLMSSGSDLLAKFSHLQYIVFAKMLLMRLRDLMSGGFRSISWWLARVLLVQQRILDERSSSLFDLLQVYTCESLHQFGTLERLTSYWGGAGLRNDEGVAIVSMVRLEAGIMEYTYGRVDACRLHFESAEAAAGLELSLTGVLGFRTVHQVEPKAQMVLVADRSLSNTGGNCRSERSVPQEEHANGGDESSSQQAEESDIYITPKLVGNDNGEEGVQVSNNGAPLSAVHQAVILARCLLIEKTTPQDDTQRWDMAPYIEAVDSQQSSCFTIRSFCDLLRIRWESNRSRTKERALMMMEKLVQGMFDSSPRVEDRITFCHGVWIPPISLLRKEYGEILVSCGLIGEAVKTFEDLELWDNLIYCYRLLEKKAAAVDLINARLTVTPNDPRLWCSLGDVTNNDSCFEKALEVSDNRSARAKRSLARSAYNRGDYETSKVLWESAMALNSLYPDGWFALGAAALKAKDVEKALDGFTRAVQLDPDNGEAWNNIACLHMMKKKSKESFIAFKEALKYNWQLWENYGHVAFDTDNISQALEAVRMVMELTKNKRIDALLLERVTEEMEKRVSTAGIEDATEHVRLDDSELISRETKQLVDFLGEKFFSCGNRGDIWGLYARWHKLIGDLTMCSEALLKQVRSYQGSDLWNDRDLFTKFAQASLELCNVYTKIYSSTGSRKELFSAEMHLKNTIKQAASFSDMEELVKLQSCLDEVRRKLEQQP